ncbi:uncharacterized protein PV06_11203 [Exophiala oligosperma]|uniref:F-box domain-containing protein n=1 Tax=Exophiala oligosperma TaxID=215243 RepID=A0A0D2DLI9_9EURO|nr:uncharacterized protein PV06_11203 [Exophiala oligosperma]KIW36549.1 hypothetical protein PV06_11203 [Exophiala oligosperma]
MSVPYKNSLYLWLCAQPDDFDPGASTIRLTPSQKAEWQQLADSAYFGWRPSDSGFRTLDRNIPYIIGDREIRVTYRAKTDPPSAGLGALNRLPIELLNSIISSLDISTLDRFKRVNRRAFEIVNAHPEFHVMNSQAHDTLRGLRAIKTSHMITVQVLFEKLCTSKCEDCGDYGGYIYLLTFQRVCCRCFTEQDRYWPLREIDALRTYGLTPGILRTLPRCQGYPGYYENESFYRNRQGYLSLIDRQSAYRAGVARHGSLQAMKEYVANVDSNLWAQFEKEIEKREKQLAAERVVKVRNKIAQKVTKIRKRNAYKEKVLTRREERQRRMAQFSLCHDPAQIEDANDVGDETDNESISTLDDTDEDTSSDRYEIFSHIAETVSWSTGECSGHALEPLRYMAMMRVPWLNRQNGRDEWGFHCVGCEQNQRWPNHARRDYIMSTFKDHLKECGPVKEGVHHINDCCKKGTCVGREKIISSPFDDPFWRC